MQRITGVTNLLRTSGLVLILILSLPVWAQTNGTASSAAAFNSSSYLIGVGDLLDIRVLNHPEMSKKTRVESERGIVRMPYIGEIAARCLTESQLSQAVAEKYRKYIKDPQVDVFVEEVVSQPPAAVIGAVATPGRFQLQRRVRLIELLTYAGGPKLENAGSVLHLIRSGEKSACATENVAENGAASEQAIPQLMTFKLRDLLTGSAEANIYIQPGDVISLPEADQIFVTGFVIKPGPQKLNTRITLTQAIGMAGGYTSEAAKKKIRLIRQSPESNNRVEQLVNVEDIEKRKTEDIVLQANDVIDVPNSTGKTIMNGIFRTALPSAFSSLPYVILR